jgi:O-antigen/teichoic acid export membrane protein
MRTSLIVRAVATSWAAVIANAASALFLTPYILHRLGDEAFGLWILVVSLVGYYGFLDAGIRASIVRYVSRHRALGDQQSINEVVAAAFYYYLGACALVIVATYLSVDWVSRFFSIRSELLSAFKSLFLLAGVVQGLTLPLLVFVGSLEAAGRFDQVYASNAACLAAGMACVIGLLRAGGGLFAVGAATILPQLSAYCICVPLAVHAHHELSLHPKWVRKSVFWDMLRYGSISVTVGIAERMRGYVYPLLIMKFLAPAAVTIFSLPVRILAFPTQGIATMTAILNPLSSQLEAQNDFCRLRRLIQVSVQSAFLLLAPMAAFLFVFGRELLALWVGSQYASSYPILVLLTLGMGTAATQCCLQSVLFGIGRHQQLVWYRFGEGLSIVLFGSAALRIWGLEGFAWVIAGTLLLTSLVLVPRHVCQILDLPLRRYLVQGYLKPCLLTLPVAAAFVVLHSVLVVQSWPTMLVVLLVGGVIYALTLLLVTLGRSRPAFRWVSLSVLQVLEQKFLQSRAVKTLSLLDTIRPEKSQVQI